MKASVLHCPRVSFLIFFGDLASEGQGTNRQAVSVYDGRQTTQAGQDRQDKTVGTGGEPEDCR